MDRLTTHDPNRRLVACRANYESWNAIYDRLAAYEDTWMTPESIIAAQKTLRCFDRIGIKRGNEIVDAELEGRLIVLPCKVGDTVYKPFLRPLSVVPMTARRIVIDGIDNQIIVDGGRSFCFCDIGRTVFLTRERAEAALGGDGG